MEANRFSPRLVIGVLIAIFFAASLSIRTVLPYEQVFTGDWIKFTGIDAYYHMRLVDNMVHNFPALTSFDPYFVYPGGIGVGNIHLFDWLLAAIVWIIGLGSPTQHLTDVVGVYFPAVLAALTVIPVYFIGKELFNRWIGVIAAALIAVIPGEFMGRSILGFTDQHIAEVLFSTVTILFLILAIKTARQRQLTFADLRSAHWRRLSQPLIYSLLAGIFLLAYLFSWLGALLFIFIISLYFVIQFIADHLRGRDTDYLGIVGGALFVVTVILFVPFAPSIFYSTTIIIAFLIPLVLSGISRGMAGRGLKPAYYPLSLLGVGLIGLGIIYAAQPSLARAMLRQFSYIFEWRLSATTLEMQPIFMPAGKFSLKLVWGNFTTGFYFSLIALGLLIWRAVKQGNAERNLFLVWSVVVLLATLGQRRFAYYLAVNVAVLTGYFSWQFLQLIALATDWLSARSHLGDLGQGMIRALDIAAKEVVATTRHRVKHQNDYYPLKYALMTLAIIIVFLFVFVYDATSAVAVARQPRFAPSDGWYRALDWMRENTPEPLSDPAAYYRLYEPPPLGEDFQYPDSAYGVTSWWDYGYWITRIAHRLPSVNPSQDPAAIRKIAHLFLSPEEAPTREIMKELDSSYIILDTQTTTTKFWAIASWADREPTEFIGRYYLPVENELVALDLFHPEYYQSLCVRLYNFNGKAVTPEVTSVICYEEKVRQGRKYKQITDVETFTSYDEARKYVERNESTTNCTIVGVNPFITPVPLEAVENYQLVYASDVYVMQPDVGAVPQVKIFEYTGGSPAANGNHPF